MAAALPPGLSDGNARPLRGVAARVRARGYRLSARAGTRLAFFPALTLALFVVPVAAGVLGTVLPAFGYLPALGGRDLSLEPWRRLFAAPGFVTALRLTLTTGFVATLLSLGLCLAFCASFMGTRLFGSAQRLVAPLLAIPHAALAIGFSFLVAPSGWLVRLLSPWATGWERPPDLTLIQDPWGAAMVVALVMKEAPFLFLMTLAALTQTTARANLTLGRTLGYGPGRAWFRFVLPLVYRQIRLPVLAVLAYSLSAVEVALVLGPTTPPPLAPLVLRWFADPDLLTRFQAAAGAVLQLLLVGTAIAVWVGAETVVAKVGRWRIDAGRRGGQGWVGRKLVGMAVLLIGTLMTGAFAVLACWSFARSWRFPDALPNQWTFGTVLGAAPAFGPPLWTTFGVALCSTALALVLVVGCLEHEARTGLVATRRALNLVYLPLVVPAIGFLFGVQVLLLLTRLDGSWTALIGAHLLFVLPYVFLSLRVPYLAFDGRLSLQALALGRSRRFVFFAIKLPLLLRPLLAACAVGFAVSVGQYLPTLFAGGGRMTTLTTEAVALASGADRRITAVYALLQAVLPLFGFFLALLVPRALYRRRRGVAVD